MTHPEMLTHYSWLEIDEHSPWYMLASSSLGEEGVERVISSSDGLVTWHLTIRLDTMLQTVKLPAGITDLDTCLSYMDGDTLTLQGAEEENIFTCKVVYV